MPSDSAILPLKSLLLLTVFLFPTAFSYAEGETALFIVTTPCCAEIHIDGVRQDKKTPLLIRNAIHGNHTVEIAKENYITLKETITVKKGENNIFRFTLSPVSLNIDFPDESYVYVNGEKSEPEGALMLDPGLYTVGKDSSGVGIRQRYRWQGVMDSLNIVIPVFTLFAGALTYSEITNPRYSEFILSPFTISAWVATALMTGADVALHIGKGRFERNSFVYRQTRSDIDGERLMREADIALEREGPDSALEKYKSFTAGFSGHSLYPEALYRISLIHIIKGETGQASAYLEEIIRDYPLPELYDRALKNLAEIRVAESDFDGALDLLDEMLFVSDMYSREDIESRKKEISGLKG